MGASPGVPRPTTPQDLHQVAEVLARAFDQDPVFRYMLPTGMSRREERLRRFFRDEFVRSDLLGGAWTAGDGAGAAIWYPPGRWKPSTWEVLKGTGSAVRVFGRQLPLATQALMLLQEHHPSTEHWYLYLLGTAPERQSTGIGSAVMAPVLRTCDERGLAAYLEASTERNRALYERHGFASGEPLQLPRSGPVMYPMWRDPR